MEHLNTASPDETETVGAGQDIELSNSRSTESPSVNEEGTSRQEARDELPLKLDANPSEEADRLFEGRAARIREIRQIAGELERLEREKQQEFERLQVENRELEMERSQFVAEIESQEEQIGALRDELEQQRAHASEMEQLHTDHKKIEAERDRLAQTLQEREEQLRQRNDELEQERQQLADSLKQKEEEIEALEADTQQRRSRESQILRQVASLCDDVNAMLTADSCEMVQGSLDGRATRDTTHETATP